MFEHTFPQGTSKEREKKGRFWGREWAEGLIFQARPEGPTVRLLLGLPADGNDLALPRRKRKERRRGGKKRSLFYSEFFADAEKNTEKSLPNRRAICKVRLARG